MSTDELIDDYRMENQQLIPASKGKRFANYMIDAIVFYIALFFFLELSGLGVIEGDLTLNLISMGCYAIYYLMIESVTGGKSLGKYVTRTKVTDYYGEPPETNQLLQRSFSRIVPFEALSFLGSKDDGWHDRWSKTMVIDENLSSGVQIY